MIKKRPINLKRNVASAFTGMARLIAVLTVQLIAFENFALAMATRPPSHPGSPPPPAWVSWAPMLVILGVFYLLIIRPQMKQRKEKQNMINALKKGDKVVTQGGLIGTIVNMGPGVVDLKLSEETKVRIQRSAITDIWVDQPISNGKTQTSVVSK